MNKRPNEKKSYNNISKKLNDNNFDYIQNNNYINSEEDKNSIEYKLRYFSIVPAIYLKLTCTIS